MEPEPTIQIESTQRTLRGQAYDILKRQLLSGELRPGERVNEVVMAARLGISRGPLREAIRNLEQEGLLIAAPHRGTFLIDRDGTVIWSLVNIKDERRTKMVPDSLETLETRV